LFSRKSVKPRYHAPEVAIFSESWDELIQLKDLGLTEHAILVYLVTVHKGKAEQKALDVLLRGRTLNSDQVELVRALLTRLYIRTTRGRAADAGV